MRMIPMIGIGLIITATASGRMSLIAGPISRSPVACHSEPDVTGGAVRLVGKASRHPVAAAVGHVAEVRAAALDAALPVLGPARVACRRRRVVGGFEPVAAPLPDVAGDVVKPEAVRLVGVDGRGAEIAVGT